jgi:hypothetical protein
VDAVAAAPGFPLAVPAFRTRWQVISRANVNRLAAVRTAVRACRDIASSRNGICHDTPFVAFPSDVPHYPADKQPRQRDTGLVAKSLEGSHWTSALPPFRKRSGWQDKELVTIPQYECVRHARVTGDPDVEWIAIGVWSFPDGTKEWTLEYWDAKGTAADDSVVPNEKAAKALAA